MNSRVPVSIPATRDPLLLALGLGVSSSNPDVVEVDGTRDEAGAGGGFTGGLPPVADPDLEFLTDAQRREIEALLLKIDGMLGREES